VTKSDVNRLKFQLNDKALKVTCLIFKDRKRQNADRWEKLYHSNSNLKKSGPCVTMADVLASMARSITKVKEHLILKKK
jgi:RNA polymerase-interacting CarD/CdnL/TRCF family regulator